MAKSIGGKIARILSVFIAAVLIMGCVFMFVGCESKKPRISIKISFNDEEHNIEYTLYRNYYKRTVNHYLELIEMKYFDGTVIHDYQSDRMVGGAFTYSDMETSAYDELVAKDYDAATKTNGVVSLDNISVWTSAEHNDSTATNRLFGENGANGFEVDGKDALSNSFGALGTYTYVTKDMAQHTVNDIVTNIQVTGDRLNDRGEFAWLDYYANSVTSMFYIYTGSSTSTLDSGYCVFGVLANDDAKDELNRLQDDIEAYEKELEADEALTDTVSVEIVDDIIDGGKYDVDFATPTCKIVIEQIKVVKY